MRPRVSLPALFAFLTAGAATAWAAGGEQFTVKADQVIDEKEVFATVESRNVVPARARIGGTITMLTVKEGDEVKEGQVIGLVIDQKLGLRIQALEAEINGLKSQLAQAQVDLARAQALVKGGAMSRQQLDQATTAVQVAQSQLKAREAERGEAEQQTREGQILAPTSGRVLSVPVTVGSVVMPGETIAQVAEQHFVLRLRVPERATRYLAAGQTVRVNSADLGASGATFGKITLVYPRIEAGNVVADAEVPGLGDYFVGQRIEVWIPAGARSVLVIPSHFIVTRFGLDYVHRKGADGRIEAIPIQRGRDFPTPAIPDGVEVLSGITPGDVLVAP